MQIDKSIINSYNGLESYPPQLPTHMCSTDCVNFALAVDSSLGDNLCASSAMSELSSIDLYDFSLPFGQYSPLRSD